MDKNYMDIEGIKYHYNGEWTDPTIEYKGMKWSEWELHDAIQLSINENIEAGYLPKDTTFESYMTDKSNHHEAIDILEEWIYAQQTVEKADSMKEAAGDIFFKTFEGEFVAEVSDIISKEAAEHFEDFCSVAGVKPDEIEMMYGDDLREKIHDFLIDNLSADELLSLARKMEVHEEIVLPCIIYVQDGMAYDLSDVAQCSDKFKELAEKQSGLYAVAYSVEGTFMQGVLDKNLMNGIDILRSVESKSEENIIHGKTENSNEFSKEKPAVQNVKPKKESNKKVDFDRD